MRLSFFGLRVEGDMVVIIVTVFILTSRAVQQLKHDLIIIGSEVYLFAQRTGRGS